MKQYTWRSRILIPAMSHAGGRDGSAIGDRSRSDDSRQFNDV